MVSLRLGQVFTSATDGRKWRVEAVGTDHYVCVLDSVSGEPERADQMKIVKKVVDKTVNSG